MNLDKMSRIDKVIASFYKEDKLSKRVKRQRQERARRLCGAAKVTGFYYKSCLFDMLTSDDATFVKAARKAMKDFRTINKDDEGRPIVNETARDFLKELTKARTTVQTVGTTTLVPSSSGYSVHESSLSVALVMLVALLQVWR
jgi:predicted transcriptional regulator